MVRLLPPLDCLDLRHRNISPVNNQRLSEGSLVVLLFLRLFKVLESDLFVAEGVVRGARQVELPLNFLPVQVHTT